MDKRTLFLLVVGTMALGCSSDPGVNAAPDPPVTASRIEKMSPEQRAAYDQAMKSRDEALAATRGKGSVASGK